jgi:hypothetical protein
MSACTRCRWGTGTTCEREPDTEASLEFKKRLATIHEERAKLDALWTTPVEEKPAQEKPMEAPKLKINTAIKTSKEIQSLADLKAERERQDSMWR